MYTVVNVEPARSEASTPDGMLFPVDWNRAPRIWAMSWAKYSGNGNYEGRFAVWEREQTSI